MIGALAFLGICTCDGVICTDKVIELFFRFVLGCCCITAAVTPAAEAVFVAAAAAPDAVEANADCWHWCVGGPRQRHLLLVYATDRLVGVSVPSVEYVQLRCSSGHAPPADPDAAAFGNSGHSR